ncbi:MAG: glycosyl transferase [Colwellia sp. Phe_37]|nr:MAG: glycosyl transferase [Colwellia sp. Phe_37]
MNKSKSNKTSYVAAVVIGRNEGQRLVACLVSLLNSVERIVYVDSGSSDNSLKKAEELGAECLSLDMEQPFTAARARNEGANYLLQKYPDIKVIQFIDGDCEIQKDWLHKAESFLDENNEYAVVCGRRRERFPERSIYNQLCDIEWNTPAGGAAACGGDALIRADAFRQVNGYRDDLIAGEEPEMCFRLREKGWKIYRLDEEMTLHDAAITKFSQWWNRAKRAGYAYASLSFLHGTSPESFKVKEVASILLWGGVLPVLVVFMSTLHLGVFFLLLLYPLQICRLTLKSKSLNKPKTVTMSYAVSTVIAKFPQFVGIMKFAVNRLLGDDAHIIEYK